MPAALNGQSQYLLGDTLLKTLYVSFDYELQSNKTRIMKFANNKELLANGQPTTISLTMFDDKIPDPIYQRKLFTRVIALTQLITVIFLVFVYLKQRSTMNRDIALHQIKKRAAKGFKVDW